MAIDLRHLRSFVAVAEELHFVRAAARLGVEQSPLSRQIKDLEASLGVRLFFRNSRHTTLTPLGERFLPDARRILTDTDVSVAALRRAATGEGLPFRLGLAEGAAGVRFSRFMRACAEQTPPIAVVLVEQSRSELASLVESGGLDAALVLDDHPTTGLEIQPAWAAPLVLATALDHPLARRHSLRLAELRSERWILPDPRVLPGYADQIGAVLRRHGVAPERPIFAAHQTSLVRLAAGGAGVALMGASMATDLAEVALIALQDPQAQFSAWLMWRPDHRSGLLERARTLMAEVAAAPL